MCKKIRLYTFIFEFSYRKMLILSRILTMDIKDETVADWGWFQHWIFGDALKLLHMIFDLRQIAKCRTVIKLKDKFENDSNYFQPEKEKKIRWFLQYVYIVQCFSKENTKCLSISLFLRNYFVMLVWLKHHFQWLVVYSKVESRIWIKAADTCIKYVLFSV